MNVSITPVVFLHSQLSRADYEYLIELNYYDVPLILFGNVSNFQQFVEIFGVDITSIKLVHIDSDQAHAQHTLYNSITTKYWVVAAPYELWGEDFIGQSSTSLEGLLPSQSALVYFLGFLSGNNTEIQYSQMASPALSKPLTLPQLFDSSIWFHPLIKVVFETEICKELKLSPHVEREWWVEYQSLVVEYLGALYTVNNFTEPSVHYFPGSFLIPKITEPPASELSMVRRTILVSEHIWQTTLWTSVYWKSLYFSKKYEPLLKNP